MSNTFRSFSELGRAFNSTAHAYKVNVPPVNLPVSLATVKEYIKLDVSDTSEDVILTNFIRTAANVFEKYTNRILITTEFRTYRDCFAECFELRRSELISVLSVEYLKDDVLTLIDPSTYYVTDEVDYGRIVLKDNKSWPSDKDNRLQSIKINFTAGYGPDDTDIPDSIRVALLQHILALYANRGDCECPSTDAAFKSLPAKARLTYDQYKIRSMVGNTWRC